LTLSLSAWETVPRSEPAGRPWNWDATALGTEDYFRKPASGR
jgi:hypothetical protein